MATLTVQSPSTVTRNRSFRFRPGLAFSLVFLSLVIIAAIWPQFLASGDPLDTDASKFNQAPSLEHWAGTDIQGRDIYTRIIYGARYSLSIGLGATIIGIGGGIILGVLSGVAGKFVDALISRTVDVLAAFPSILFALVVIGLLGTSVQNLIIALGISTIPAYARVVRGQTMQVVDSGYVEQATTFGISRPRIILRHILPNALGVVPGVATIELGRSIMGAAALSFIGLGPQGPTPEWGLMLSESRDFLRVAPWWGIAPGIVLTLTIISATVVGRYLQASYEKRNR